MQLTLALLELPAPPAMPGVPLDPEARAKAVETLARMIAQALTRFTQPQNEMADAVPPAGWCSALGPALQAPSAFCARLRLT